MNPARPTRLEVDLDAIGHNVAVLADRAGDAEVCAVVKADGYGHGAAAVARAAVAAGASWLAVALVEEGEELREGGVDAPILLLSEPPAEAAPRIVEADLVASVCTPAFGHALDAAASDAGRACDVHLLVDTGMGRVGATADHWLELFEARRSWDALAVSGLWTHLARADEPDAGTTEAQLERFADARQLAAANGITDVVVHAANSAGTLLFPQAHFDMVRTGIAVYGLSPAPDLPADRFGLRQALRLVSEVSFVKHVPEGTPVSYGHTWTSRAAGWVATVPVGYADGVPRALSNRAEAIWNGRRVPFVGNVTMDQLLLWCGDEIPQIGDEVVFLGTGQAGGFVGVDEWAHLEGTISYEVACAIGKRVPRRYDPSRS
jgi:alanine racemase